MHLGVARHHQHHLEPGQQHAREHAAKVRAPLPGEAPQVPQQRQVRRPDREPVPNALPRLEVQVRHELDAEHVVFVGILPLLLVAAATAAAAAMGALNQDKFPTACSCSSGCGRRWLGRASDLSTSNWWPWGGTPRLIPLALAVPVFEWHRG